MFSGGKVIILALVTITAYAALSQRRFHLQRKGLRRGPQRLDKGWTDKSRRSCAKNCMESYINCKSFMFNHRTGLCTPGGKVNQNESSPSTAEGDLFQMLECDTSSGFKIETYSGTSYCIGRFGPTTYEEADEECTNKGGFLMSVKTGNKLNVLYYNVWKYQKTWVGCDDLAEEGTFIWKEDNRAVTATEYSQIFAPGEPNDYMKSEDCVAIVSGPKGLSDYNCSYSMHYACEMHYV